MGTNKNCTYGSDAVRKVRWRSLRLPHAKNAIHFDWEKRKLELYAEVFLRVFPTTLETPGSILVYVIGYVGKPRPWKISPLLRGFSLGTPVSLQPGQSVPRLLPQESWERPSWGTKTRTKDGRIIVCVRARVFYKALVIDAFGLWGELLAYTPTWREPYTRGSWNFGAS